MRERQCVRCMQWLCCVLVVGKVWRIVSCVYKIYTLDRFQFHGLLRNIPTRFGTSGGFVIGTSGGFVISFSGSYVLWRFISPSVVE